MNILKFLLSEFIVCGVALSFTYLINLYLRTESKIIFIQAMFWFFVLIGFAWYGAYHRLKKIEVLGK